MIDRFHAIVSALCNARGQGTSLTGIHIREQFVPAENTPDARLRNLNAAFLIALSGPLHPLFQRADNYLSQTWESDECRTAAAFYRHGLKAIPTEFLGQCAGDEKFARKVDALHAWVQDPACLRDREATVNSVWQVFFPEGVGIREHREHHINALRRKRTVHIERLNPHPIEYPLREILFTANVLLTLPPGSKDIETLPFNRKLREKLAEARGEPQLFWYDHPVQIGVPTDKNEVLYGLRGLDRAIAFEKQRGTVGKEKLTCMLSVSVTHRGLRAIGRECLQEMLRNGRPLKHVRVYACTESDTAALVERVLAPAAKHYLGEQDPGTFADIIGVDGEYGRHYSFLKAVAALWQVFIDPVVRGTFKIDLDQVFPQKELVQETGCSAFEHFKTPLWGAAGTDSRGQNVSLGMLAGALVNQEDMGRSLFAPDVLFPDREIFGSEWVFFSRLPQALSTAAEMTARYGEPPLDGEHNVIQRVHVTGGTTGILVDHLRTYRPFTPTFVGRAEDQAYLLSMLGQRAGSGLRFLHKAGLIMRHDKEAFAKEAILAAATGKTVGDFIRILTFSSYAKALGGDKEAVKNTVDPFTGCFISRLPITVVFMRFALDVASYLRARKTREAMELARLGMRRLGAKVRELGKEGNPLKERYEKEKRAWKIFYDVLDRVEQGLKKGDHFALDLQKEARHLAKECDLSNF